jgi:hypothetical protein
MKAKIKYSKWTPWENRHSIKEARLPGVYLIARFKRPPSGKVNLTSKHIVYIGETCGNSLLGRWSQFNRSVFSNKRGHSGGRTYRELFGSDSTGLYVCAVTVHGLNQILQSLYIRYLERKYIWGYSVKRGRAPICNRK